MNKNSKIYVAGHKGLVGSALVRVLNRQGFSNVIGRTRKELDLTNQSEVNQFFESERPEYVFLAAAKVGGFMRMIPIQQNSYFLTYRSKTISLMPHTVTKGKSCVFLDPLVFIQNLQNNLWTKDNC